MVSEVSEFTFTVPNHSGNGWWPCSIFPYKYSSCEVVFPSAKFLAPKLSESSPEPQFQIGLHHANTSGIMTIIGNILKGGLVLNVISFLWIFLLLDLSIKNVPKKWEKNLQLKWKIKELPWVQEAVHKHNLQGALKQMQQHVRTGGMQVLYFLNLFLEKL